MFMSVLYLVGPFFCGSCRRLLDRCHGWLRRCASPGGTEGAATGGRQPAAARSAARAERAGACGAEGKRARSGAAAFRREPKSRCADEPDRARQLAAGTSNRGAISSRGEPKTTSFVEQRQGQRVGSALPAPGRRLRGCRLADHTQRSIRSGGDAQHASRFAGGAGSRCRIAAACGAPAVAVLQRAI